ncbi:hypothetical protein QTO34_018161 [Cnephaeus nilssonii]|uniref:Uncharacterized protein n=1 Tax=Cnephaeus nilssonii TaxID=3371016 RepID=A0AA40HYD8_CNENI|nr:hypothetical protein QTO34_018161 [Eptesicus nilssonii]
MEAGHKLSKKKAQVCQKEVKYLSFRITQGKRMLGAERKQAVFSIPVPTSLSGRCWVLLNMDSGFSELAKPLDEALKGEEKASLVWGPDQEKMFTTI